MDKNKYEEWYADLKIGDTVVYPSSGRWHGETIVKITRSTPSGMLGLSNGRMTNKDGSIRGDKHFRIHPVTQKVIDQIERRKMLHKINEFRFDRLNNEDLKKICSIIL